MLVTWHEALRRRGADRPILSGYMPRYCPKNEPDGRVDAILDLAVQERHQGLVFRLIGHQVNGAERLSDPIPGRFTSLHLLFADGRFNEDVPFDPDIYFFADEVAIALRAYTHGYDLYQPHRVIGWHLYDRSTRIPHWSDHPGWEQQNAGSMARLRQLYRGELQGHFGIGTRRSVQAYEAHIGTSLIDTSQIAS